MKTKSSLPSILFTVLSIIFILSTRAYGTTEDETIRQTLPPEAPESHASNMPKFKIIPRAQQGNTLRITGKITNYEKAASFLTKDAYLQLVPAHGIKFEIDNRGRTVFLSQLPKTIIDRKGKFVFNFDTLQSGSYGIAAQLTNINIGAVIPILAKGDVFVIFDAPKLSGQSAILELGDITIPLPH